MRTGFWERRGGVGGGGGANIASSYKELYGVMWFLRQKQYLWT